jgi:hypothetical protein
MLCEFPFLYGSVFPCSNAVTSKLAATGGGVVRYVKNFTKAEFIFIIKFRNIRSNIMRIYVRNFDGAIFKAGFSAAIRKALQTGD